MLRPPMFADGNDNSALNSKYKITYLAMQINKLTDYL